MATLGYFYGTDRYTGGSDGNNINVYVKHYATAANQGFRFPVGSGIDLRMLTISGSITLVTDYATACIVGNPTTTIDPTDAAPGMYAITSVGTGQYS